jgi:uncharacterized membrane protein YdfJ with MMPL/SSD domain
MTLCGLVAALLGNGIWDWLSWLALLAPVGICLYVLLLAPDQQEGEQR